MPLAVMTSFLRRFPADYFFTFKKETSIGYIYASQMLLPILLNVIYCLLFELSIRSISFNEYSSISKISDSALSFRMR